MFYNISPVFFTFIWPCPKKIVSLHAKLYFMRSLKGLGIALATPYGRDMSVDYVALGRLVEEQIKQGADYLVVLGTTAETPTLSAQERREVKSFVASQVAGRVPLVLGVGGNCTQVICEQLKNEDLTGYDAILSVVPYYNRPTQEGCYQHFMAIAEASPLPVVLYNIPARTGTNLLPETVCRLAKDSDKIVAIKEASGDLMQIAQLLREKPEDFLVISGDDSLTVQVMSVGAVGVISVCANVKTQEMSKMVHLAQNGRYKEATAIANELAPLLKMLFAEGNPAGIKAAMAVCGFGMNALRLPLVPVSRSLYLDIEKELQK